MAQRREINPGQAVYSITNYRVYKRKYKYYLSCILGFDLYITIKFLSGREDVIMMKNCMAWRNHKGIVIWRTCRTPTGSGGYYFPTVVSKTVYDDIVEYIDNKFGEKLLKVEYYDYKRTKGASTVEEALKLLEAPAEIK